MARHRYPFARPLVPEPNSWLGFLEASYEQRWFTNRGPVARELEQELARHVGGGRAVATASSATAGITAALLALGVRGAVAVPAFTFPATIHAIEAAGCRPILCDVDPDTWELDPASAREAVERLGCSAIVHVRAFGLCRDLTAIERAAAELGVPLVVDSAAAFGGTTPTGVPVGRAADAEVFSFHATKVFAVGEGGAVAASPELVERIHHAANFAIAGADVTGRGLNGKLSDLAAAVGRAMLRELDAHVRARRTAAGVLAGVAARWDVTTPGADAGSPPWQCVPLALPDGIDRDAMLASLATDGIEGRAYYCPGLHRSRAWEGDALGRLVATDELAQRSVCMPLYSDLTDDELEHFAAALERALDIASGAAMPVRRAA